MLEITIPETEYFDESTQSFVIMSAQKLRLEHSLLSVAKWESKWHKPFLGKQAHSQEEVIDYVRCMTINPNVDPNIYYALTSSNIAEIEKYIEDSSTATWFRNNQSKKPSREVITAEIIYYWMIELGVPFECEKWHLNRLMTLIQVCSEKQSGGKKMGKKDILKQNTALNAARKKRFNTRG